MRFEEYTKDLYKQLLCNASTEYASNNIVYDHTEKEIEENMDFFETMYNCGISAYKALLFFCDYKYLNGEKKNIFINNYRKLNR